MSEHEPPPNRNEITCNCKVGTVIEEYHLEGMNEELADEWAGTQNDSASVRTLAERLNRQILRVEMTSAGMDPVDGRVSNLYRLLTDDDVLDAMALQARTVLEEAGIDIDALKNEFVSHQTIYRHLRTCLAVEKATKTVVTETERTRLNRLQNRSAAVIDDSISRLRQTDEISLDTFEVLVNFRVTCETCGTLYDVADLLDQGGCHCQNSTMSA
jgi:hypothetical protein